MREITIILALLCIVTFAQQKGSFTDSRDGKKYKTVEIGEQVWMAENLNYDVKSSKCYYNEPANCNKYGRLYNWVAAKEACPKGWHLPSDEKWQMLVDYAGGSEVAGAKLKAKNGWNVGGIGLDTYGFSALPGGVGYGSGYGNVDGYGNWWSATESDANLAWSRHMNYGGEYVRTNNINKSFNLFSVRCLRD